MDWSLLMIFENEDVKFDYFNETLAIKYAGGERNWEVIPSKSIDKIDRFSFELNNETYTVIVIKYNRKLHFWSDISSNEYDDLLTDIANKKPHVVFYLKKYSKIYGYEHKFWESCCQATERIYGYDGWLDLSEGYELFPFSSQRVNFISNFKKEIFNDLYDNIVNYFLPDKIEATKNSLLSKEANEKQTAITDIYGECFHNKEAVLNDYAQSLKNDISKLPHNPNSECFCSNLLNKLKAEKAYWTNIKNKNIGYSIWSEEYIEILSAKEKILNEAINLWRSQENEKKTCQEQTDNRLLNEKSAQPMAYTDSEIAVQKYTENQKKDSLGEKEVNYALKWLDKSYIKVSNPNNEKAISLYNPEFIDEPQEYDHIIVGKQGVFNIETKNFAGKLIVDVNGNWIRVRDNQMEGERNPIQQVRRHEKLLRSIIGSDIPIINIICMAHPKLIIEGVENCSVPIIKSDLLVEFIETYKSDINISEDEIKKCVTQIENHIK